MTLPGQVFDRLRVDLPADFPVHLAVVHLGHRRAVDHHAGCEVLKEAPRRANIALWVIDKLSKGEVINVVTDQWRTPTYAPDLAAGIEQIVRFGKTGIYHLSGRELVSIYEFAQTIARVFDLDASLIHPTDGTRFRQKAARPPRTGFIILKAETELGYKPRMLETALGHLGTRLGLPATTS